MLEIFQILRELMEQKLKSLFSLCAFIELNACLMKQLVIKNFIFDLCLVLFELFVHSFPSFSITEGNHSIKVIMSQLSWFEFSCLDEIVEGNQSLEK